ncbi:UNVERIFIED_CONTAM: hypothetical protein GTU68_002578 [Idotea baltica]|nr:hypothetical protein [Idotea baltica]
MGIEFPNPVGLAAGFDKDGEAIEGLFQLGFGFIEVGTVTPKAQPGNPSPRLFRLPEKKAIINRMGFNNKGVDHLIEKIKNSNYHGILGINIGKNFTTPIENAVDDYLYCLERSYVDADYIAINLSSPNTPGLRSLQADELRRQELSIQHSKMTPLVIKLAPDLLDEELIVIAKAAMDFGIDGIIATNTTLSRDAVSGLKYSAEQGGLSGGPLKERSTEVVRILARTLQGKIPIIAVGGILSGNDAAEKISAGASLVQLYSGFIYKGPQLISDAIKAISCGPL